MTGAPAPQATRVEARVEASPDARPEASEGSGRMFDAIAGRYDLVNRVMSFGTDQSWRRAAVEALAIPPDRPVRILDVATGTADVALRVLARHPRARVDGIDPSANMLSVAAAKASARALKDRLALHEGDARALPWLDATFDGCIIAFGIRNVPDRPRALSEMARVVRPGARVVVLELTEPRAPLLGPIARFHVHRLVPRLGALLSGKREYDYLQRSIARFPPQEVFAETMRAAGLEVERLIPRMFGAATIFVGRRPGTHRTEAA